MATASMNLDRAKFVTLLITAILLVVATFVKADGETKTIDESNWPIVPSFKAR